MDTSKEWRMFSDGEPDPERHIYFVYEHEDWYDGPLLASRVLCGLRLEDGRYCSISAEAEIITDVTFVAWRYVPPELTHPGFEREMAEAIVKYSAQRGS